MITYRIIKETYQNKELGTYTSYGIEAVSIDGKISRLAYVPDAFTDQTEAEALAQLFSSLALDPMHLNDAISDFLGQTGS